MADKKKVPLGKPLDLTDKQLEVLSEIERVGVGGSLRFGVHRNQHVRLFRVEPVAKPAPASAEASAAPAGPPPLPSAALEKPAPGKSD